MFAAAITETQREITIAVIAAAVTIVVAVMTGLTAYYSSKRQQRRKTYSEAVRAAVAWKEMVYRVRRRRESTQEQLIADFHKLQDELSYYEAWVASESVYMSRSYKRLVAGVKKETLTLVQQAWKEDIRPLPGDARKTDVHPDISNYVDAFLLDVRRHVSPWPWRKIRMACNNREGKN